MQARDRIPERHPILFTAPPGIDDRGSARTSPVRYTLPKALLGGRNPAALGRVARAASIGTLDTSLFVTISMCTGDRLGDPCKDTASSGPDPLIKVICIEAPANRSHCFCG
jgi:hypothetical protein